MKKFLQIFLIFGMLGLFVTNSKAKWCGEYEATKTMSEDGMFVITQKGELEITSDEEDMNIEIRLSESRYSYEGFCSQVLVYAPIEEKVPMEYFNNAISFSITDEEGNCCNVDMQKLEDDKILLHCYSDFLDYTLIFSKL